MRTCGGDEETILDFSLPVGINIRPPVTLRGLIDEPTIATITNEIMITQLPTSQLVARSLPQARAASRALPVTCLYEMHKKP